MLSSNINCAASRQWGIQSWSQRRSKQALRRIREGGVFLGSLVRFQSAHPKLIPSAFFWKILTAEQKLFASINNANTSQLWLNHFFEKSNLTPPKQKLFTAQFALNNDLTLSYHLSNQTTETGLFTSIRQLLQMLNTPLHIL